MAHNNTHHDEEAVQVQQPLYTATDLIQFESQNKLTSIGKMILSTKSSAPAYGFGTATRKKQEKVFASKEFAKSQFFGKTSPGPNYEVRDTDKFYYKDEPKWSFSKTARNTLNIGPKHAHYLREDVDFDPVAASQVLLWNHGVPKIGLESRFADAGTRKNQVAPGPDYNPPLRPEIPNAPSFSLGIRREVKGASPLLLLASTPKEVGPGSYPIVKQGITSPMAASPKVSFTKADRLQVRDMNIGNQTYDTRSCLGDQIVSKNRSMAQISIGKAKKDAFTGIFKDTMSTQPTSIRIQHRY